MYMSRSVTSEEMQKILREHEYQDPVNNKKQNMVKTNNKLALLVPSSQHLQQLPTYSNNDLQQIEEGQDQSTLAEQVRIKGQQKQLYIKQCRLKKMQSQQIFQNYPFSNMEAFIFNEEVLKDQNGKFICSIIEDQIGIHLVQDYSQAILNSKYSQLQIKQSTYNGLSISILNDGAIVEGNYNNGVFCGLCYQLQSNGDTFIGNFKDGVKTGKGSFYSFSNNQIYIGDWLGGLPHGSGLYIGKDKYQGSFLNGLKFGFGQQVFANGDKYIGQYVNSVSEGYGEYYWADGSYYKGDFKQGVRHGYGIWQDEKQIYKGNYRMDKKQGFGIYKWISKQVYKGEFRNDYRSGYGEFYSIGKNEKETIIYKGCWLKGKKSQDGKVDETKIKHLYTFLDQSYRLGQTIEQLSKKKDKKRIGHKGCVPNDPTSKSNEHIHK